MTENPYENLYIYYFEGVPALDPGIERSREFLGTWVDEGVSFLFFSAPSRQTVAGIEKANPAVKLVDTYEMTGEAWHGDRIEPYTIGNLNICPPWLSHEPSPPGETRVFLDPGVVFGTGRHPTTEECLTLIHRLSTKTRLETVVDIGTGTGLLALGAAALGARRVLACDFNYLAVKTALNNVRINKMGDRILAFQARGEQMMTLDCDLLVANIHYDVMQHMIRHPLFSQKPHILLSGLLHSETAKVMAELDSRGVHVLERRCPDGVWNTLLCRPKG